MVPEKEEQLDVTNVYARISAHNLSLKRMFSMSSSSSPLETAASVMKRRVLHHLKDVLWNERTQTTISLESLEKTGGGNLPPMAKCIKHVAMRCHPLNDAPQAEKLRKDIALEIADAYRAVLGVTMDPNYGFHPTMNSCVVEQASEDVFVWIWKVTLAGLDYTPPHPPVDPCKVITEVDDDGDEKMVPWD